LAALAIATPSAVPLAVPMPMALVKCTTAESSMFAVVSSDPPSTTPVQKSCAIRMKV